MIEKVIKFKASDGSLWDTEEDAVKHMALAEIKYLIDTNLDYEDQIRYTDVLLWIKEDAVKIYSELHKIIPKEQLKELDKE